MRTTRDAWVRAWACTGAAEAGVVAPRHQLAAGALAAFLGRGCHGGGAHAAVAPAPRPAESQNDSTPCLTQGLRDEDLLPPPYTHTHGQRHLDHLGLSELEAELGLGAGAGADGAPD